MSSKDIQISKQLAWLLRHGAEESKVKIRPDGFVLIDDILSLPNFKRHRISMADLQRIVTNNDKKRFEMKNIDGKFYIRASQGHSIKSVNQDDLLTPIIDPKPYPIVVHGTYQEFWPQIKIQGLKKMSRNHIHFAPGYPNGQEVISGMRKTCNVFIEIDLEKALNDGIKFFISNNRVILTEGIDGVLPPKYFKNVFDPNDTSLIIH